MKLFFRFTQVCWPIAVGSLLFACVAPPRNLVVEQRSPSAKIDSQGWDALLAANVDDGFVTYRGFCHSAEFRRYLEALAGADLTGAGRAEILSFFINAYNATAIQSILDGESPATVLSRYRFFRRNRHPVAGEEITLWALEHDRLRLLGDPRIHFAIVCASRSCPRLASQAYAAGTLDQQLDIATRNFVNDPERNHFHADEKVAAVSAIFDWYKEDFTEGGATLSDYLAHYAEDPQVAADLRDGKYRIRFLGYEWDLNGKPPGFKGRCPGSE